MTAFAGKTLQFGVVPTETKKSMTGLDLLTGIKNGTLPAPPIQQVLDFRISRLKRGHTVFLYRCSARFVHGMCRAFYP